MRITSTSTYILPFIILFLASVSIAHYFLTSYIPSSNNLDETSFTFRLVQISLILTTILYILFRQLTLNIGSTYFKYSLFIFPLCFDIVLSLIINKTYDFSFTPCLSGILLFYALHLLTYRYVATLTTSTIEYKNLLGQSGTISLKLINRLEQKRNFLSFLREFKFLELTKKTAIGFCDEHLDEYEINIFTRAFNNKKIFDSIINNANKCDNFKIRMYTV